ncbi:hypothetical protein JCM3775_003993 [Rhodotorula graminis]
MAQAAVALSPHLHDSSLAAAFGGRLSPSPWSRFLSPSLFSQRSSTPSQTLAPPLAAAAPPPAAAGSPLKESTTVHQPHQPGQFTHAREINPFERSFAVLDGTAAIPLPRGADGGPAPFGGGAGLHLGGRLKRKRALSSPALFTPGGSPHQPDYLAHEAADEDDDMRAFLQAKRPGLRFAPNNDSGVGFVEAGPAVDMAPSGSAYSLRSRGSSSGHNSFDSTTGTSLLGRRRAQSASDSPDTSVAPSPPSPKLGVGADTHQFGGQVPPSTFTHFQPQPLAFSMPPSTTVAMPFGDPNVLALSTLGPASIAPHAVAPLPFAAEPQPFEPVAMPLDPMTSFVAAYPTAPQPFASGPPNPTSLAAPLPHPLGMPAAVPHPVPAPATHTGPSPVPIPHSRLPPMPASARAPTAAPVAGTSAFLPPYAAPTAPAPAASTAKASKKASPVAGPSRQLGPAPLFDEADDDDDDDAAPAAPTRPAGKKRGRKPKNWDPTLETTVELDPEEQEKQRKLALERNRVAASKSRRRKKERVELLETASTDLCSRNLALQAECRNLFTEVHALRTMLAQAHPEHSCQCPHIVGYVVRERDGGGIPAILYGASGTTERDYTRVPKWGTEDDVFAGTVEAQALDVIAGGGTSLVNMVGGRGGAEYPRATSSIRSDTPGPSMHYQHPHPHSHPHQHVQPIPMVAPVAAPHHVVGASAGHVRQPLPLKAPSASTSTGRSPSKKSRASAAAAMVGGEGESDESEEETVTLKSRRARAISTRNK